MEARIKFGVDLARARPGLLLGLSSLDPALGIEASLHQLRLPR